jgi:hypothetical protein
MRRDKKGNLITLEEDIREIWKQHGLTVISEEVKSLKLWSIWIIRAKVKK